MFEQSPRRQKLRQQRLAFGNLPVPGTKVGAVVSVGLVVVAWLAVPLARAFIVGVFGVGAMLGAFLWWLHNRE
jgi:hypothetical protein